MANGDKPKHNDKNDDGKIPSDGTMPDIGDDLVEAFGYALIKIGEEYYTTVITKQGKIVHLPTERAYNEFAKTGKYVNLKRVSNFLKVGGKWVSIAGQGAVIVGVMFNAKALADKEITGSRFIYRFGVAGTSTAVGASLGGFPGALVGAIIGTFGWLGEKAYDKVILPTAIKVESTLRNPTNLFPMY